MPNLPFEFTHGGYIKEETLRKRIALRPPTTEAGIDVETDFDYLFADLARNPNSLLPADNNQDIIAKLKDLGEKIIDANQPEPEVTNSNIPPVYTYWGQFIDHDITANTDSNKNVSDITQPDVAPLTPTFVTTHLRNGRQPALNLDSVYGDGPTFPGGAPTEAANMYDG